MHSWPEQVVQSAVSGFDWNELSALATMLSAVVSAAALACTPRFLLRQDRILTHQLELSTETKRYELYQNVMKEMQEISGSSCVRRSCGATSTTTRRCRATTRATSVRGWK